MAFNFNWSPLTADAEFYQRARELLTTALNKNPKPPIIVDDILVTEFNLGSVPPELEILEIGDIAEDRFRGIFKMCYSGDAFLTLKTRVQVGCFFFFRSLFRTSLSRRCLPARKLQRRSSGSQPPPQQARQCPHHDITFTSSESFPFQSLSQCARSILRREHDSIPVSGMP